MSKRVFLVVCSSFAATCAALAVAPPDVSRGPDSGRVAQRDTAREAFRTFDLLRKANQPVDAATSSLWSRRLMTAERGLADTKAGRVAAAQAHVERAKALMDEGERKSRMGILGRLDFLDIQFRYNEAVTWLQEEKAR